MSWMWTVVREVFGLFVDDGSFAMSILVWVGLCGFLLPRVGVAAGWVAPVFVIGLAGILVESAIRYARRSKRL